VLSAGGVLVASAANSVPSTFVATSPVRVLDTRPASSPIKILGPGAIITLSLAAYVPADATAVTLNVTALQGTATSFLTVYPTGATP
jgi:hypothetical protein